MFSWLLSSDAPAWAVLSDNVIWNYHLLINAYPKLSLILLPIMTELSAANVHNLTEGYRNRTIIAASICFPMASLAVALRFTARKISGSAIWYDDWFALAGLVCCDKAPY